MCVNKLAQLIRGWFSRVPIPVGEESDSSGVPGLDWFVSPTGSDDTGDGSFDNPWATPSYASSQVTEAGDIIHVRSGSYTDNNRVVLALGVWLIGDPWSYPNITVGYVATSGADAYIYMNTTAGDAVDGSHTIAYLNLDANLTGTRAIAANYRSNVIVHHCNFDDFFYSGIRFNGCGSWDSTPTNTLPTGNKVYECTFDNCSQLTGNAGYIGHIRLNGQNGAEVYNCTFDQTDRVSGENTDIMCGYQNRGVKIHNCTFTKDDLNDPDWNFFAEFHYSNGGFELYNNEFNGAACWDASGNEDLYSYGFGLRVYGNTFQTSGPPPIDSIGYRQAYLDLESFTHTDDVYVYKNHFKYARIGIMYNNVQVSSDNVWIYDNKFEDVGNADDNGSYGIKIGSDWDESDPIPFSNIHILNNTIDCGANAYAGITVVFTGDVTNFDIRNNIINGNFSYPIKFEPRSGSTPTVTNLNVTDNILFGGGVTTINYVAGVTYVGGDHDDADNLEDVDPLFVGGSPYDFHLASTDSPAYHAGVDVGLDTDYDGVAWESVPSIGCYEYV